MSRTMSRMFLLTVLGAVVMTTACQGPNMREKAVNAANDRWKAARTGLILQMAQRQFDTGDLEQAEKSLVDALNRDPANPMLHVLGARISLERGQLERSFRQLEIAVELKEEYAEAHYFMGIVLQRWQQFDRALASYRRAYALEPDAAAYLLAEAEMLVALDRGAEALALLQDKKTYFDQNAAIRVAIGQLHMLAQDHDQAVRYFREASLLRPDDRHVTEELAAALMAAGHHADAARELERLLADGAYSRRNDLRTQLAEAYQATGRHEMARRVYQDLRSNDPDNADVWIKLGELSWVQGDMPGALTAANRAMSIAPHRHEGFLLAGLVWQRRGRTEEALRLFDRAASLAPTSAEPMVMRGITLQRAGRHDAAAEAYQEALRRRPDDTRARELLASLK